MGRFTHELLTIAKDADVIQFALFVARSISNLLHGRIEQVRESDSS